MGHIPSCIFNIDVIGLPVLVSLLITYSYDSVGGPENTLELGAKLTVYLP